MVYNSRQPASAVRVPSAPSFIWMQATAALVLLIALIASELEAAEAPVKISDQPQLFLDDYLEASAENVKREIVRPIKHSANPLIVRTLPWEKRLIAIYGTVLYDENARKYRMWYTAGENKDGIPDVPEHPVTAEYFICYAESDDGIHWEKPLVSTDKFGLHDKHNIVIPGGHGFCVLPSPDADEPGKRYRGVGGAIFGFSADGIRWETHDWRGAVGKNDTSSCVVRWNDEYLAFVRYQVQDPKWPGVMRGIGLTLSKDFQTWSPKQAIFTTDEKDGYPWTQPYGIAVTPYGDKLIGILSLLHLDKVEGNNSLGDEDTQLVVSRDGRNWGRVADRSTFLAPSPGAWDQGRIHAPATSMLVKDDVVHIYYSASDQRHGTEGWGTSGIGLATLPADRFVALRQEADSAAGVLQTPLLEYNGDTLLVNADADESSLQVELLDKSGRVLPGFDRQSCRLLPHDNLRHRVVWDANGGQHLLAAAGKRPVALRFILNGAALYAFQIVRQPAEKSRVIELSLKGTPYERGFQHGQRFANDICASIDHFKSDLRQRELVEAINKTIALIDERFPELNEEIRGISAGAEVPFVDAFLFNNRAIVSQVSQETCSNIAVESGDAVILGMNKDRPTPIPAYDKYFLKKVYPKDGYAFIGYGHVGRVWGHGMNEKGLCTAGTAAHPERNNPALPSIGSYFLPPLLLSKCKNVPQALALLDEIDPVCDSGNFLLCDASGEMVVVELTPERRIVRKANDGRIAATTFFASGEIPHRNEPEYLQEAQQRFGTIERCMEGQSNAALEDMKELLRHHGDVGPVCLHDRRGNSTVLSWIAMPRSREFYFCNGPPCQSDYQLYKLDE